MDKSEQLIACATILEFAVLEALVEVSPDSSEPRYASSLYLERATGIAAPLVRALVGMMIDRGEAEYCRGLMNDSGELAGSGYAPTMAGHYIAREGRGIIKTHQLTFEPLAEDRPDGDAIPPR